MKLHEAFSVASHALAKRDFVPHYQHFMVRNGHITACDERVGIRTLSTPDCGVNACIPGTALLAAMSPDAELAHVGNGVQVTCEGGHFVTKLPTLPTTEYPLLWPRPTDAIGTISLPAYQLGVALSVCLAGAGVDEDRPELLGITLQTTVGHAQLFASNNATITNVTVVTDDPTTLPPFVIPDPLARALAKVCSQVHALSTAKLILTDTKIFVTIGEDIEMFGVATSTTVLDHYKVIQGLLMDTENGMDIVPIGWDEAVKNADRVLGKDSYHGATVDATGRTLKVHAKNGDYSVDVSLLFNAEASRVMKFDTKLLARRPKQTCYMAFTNNAVVFTSEDDLIVYAVSAVAER